MGQTHRKLDLEYAQINENFRFLADVRFKLLALVPTLGGAAVFVLTRAGLQTGTAPSSSTSELLTVIVVGLIGFLATLGITLYDQRNSELYNALIHRAKHLEEEFGVPSTPGGLRKTASGGQFSERPKKARRFILEAGHDLGLALIYGPLLGAWLFPLAYAAMRLMRVTHGSALTGAAVLAAAGTLVFARRLVVLDRRDRDLYHAAALRDRLPFDTKRLAATRDAVAPDGSDVRILLGLTGGGMAHFELAPGQTSRAVTHRTVEEIWFILSGRGEMWRRRNGQPESVVPVESGVCLTIPLGTHFQFRSLGAEPLAALAVTIPPWPGEEEAIVVEGKWAATAR